MTNVFGDFYGGKAGGWAHFVFPDTDHAQYAFGVNVTNARLSPLVADVTQTHQQLGRFAHRPTQHHQRFDGDVELWNGYGGRSCAMGCCGNCPSSGLSRPWTPSCRRRQQPFHRGVRDVRHHGWHHPLGIWRCGRPPCGSEIPWRSEFRRPYPGRVIAEPVAGYAVVGSVVSTILARGQTLCVPHHWDDQRPEIPNRSTFLGR